MCMVFVSGCASCLLRSSVYTAGQASLVEAGGAPLEEARLAKSQVLNLQPRALCLVVNISHQLLLVWQSANGRCGTGQPSSKQASQSVGLPASLVGRLARKPVQLARLCDQRASAQ